MNAIHVFVAVAIVASPPAVAQTTVDSTDVTFARGESGAVTRTLDARGKDVLYLTDFGAICDNSTDNSVALQSFLNAVIATSKRGYIPGCTSKYRFSTTLAIGGSTSGMLDVFGDGKYNSVINYSGTGSAMSVAPSTISAIKVTFRNFGVYNESMNYGYAGVYQTNTPRAIYEDMAFYNQFNCLSFGSGSWAARVSRAGFNTCGSAGAGAAITFATDHSANNASIRDIFVGNGGGYGIYIPNGNNITLDNVDIEGNYGGIVLGGGVGGVTSMSVSGYIEGSGNGGNIVFLGSGSTSAAGVTLQNLWLGSSVANNWDYVQGLIIKNLTTYNYAPYITNNSKATVENLITMGTGGLTWAAGSTSSYGVSITR